MRSEVSLAQHLAAFAREGELYERLDEGRVRCDACGHRCVIPPGHRGICKVRWNDAGRLLVPAGYVAALQLDPVEKKPFFHAYPGALALSFGMLGCDLHCAYCTLGPTLVATSRGPVPIRRLFESGREIPGEDPSTVRASPDLEVYTHAGRTRGVRALFRHRYRGPVVKLEPAGLLPLHLTPDHEVLAVDPGSGPGQPVPRFVPARLLTTRHCVAVPGRFEFSRPPVLDVAEVRRPGTGSRFERLPRELFSAPRAVVDAFLDAYVVEAGHRRGDGCVAVVTGSRRLALGIAWLVLKTGRLPRIRVKRRQRVGNMQGRTVSLAPKMYSIEWSEDAVRRRLFRHDERYVYVPLRRISTCLYDGFVYNLDVADDHSYLAQLVGTHNCQNWLTSQALRDPVAGVAPEPVTAARLADLAVRHRARILTSTYNEPLITSEWAVEVFKAARARGLACSFVSNGNATPEVLAYLRPWVDLYKVDLKGFDDRRYRKLGGLLATVLDTIRRLHALGFWLEVVTLVVPGFNDAEAELRDIARFLVSVSPDIPWHVTAFHPDYRMTDREGTPARALVRAAELGRSEGLRYVYAGNLPGRVGPFEHTWCPSCGALLIERRGFVVLQDRLTPTGGRCPACAAAIPGRWG